MFYKFVSSMIQRSFQIFRQQFREVLAEALGTFILVFAITGAIMTQEISEGAITHLGISFVSGAVVTVLIYGLGHISQAHFNPAVTLAFWSSGFFPKNRVFPYILAQCFGAIAASLTLLITLGRVGNLGATVPLEENWLQSLILEGILTFILMLVILGSGLDRRAPLGFAGIAISLTVALEAAFMGPITGASMNPARSLGPALVSGVWEAHWIYWIAPIVGAQLSVIVYRVLSNDFLDFQEKEQWL